MTPHDECDTMAAELTRVVVEEEWHAAHPGEELPESMVTDITPCITWDTPIKKEN